MNNKEPLQATSRFLTQIDFYFQLMTILFSLVQLSVVDFLGYAIRWDRSISFLLWFLFFKSGIDLLIPALFYANTKPVKKLAGESQDDLDDTRKLVISGVLIVVSFIPFSRLITSPLSSMWMQFNLVFTMTSVLIIFREHPLISRYSELVGSFLMTFLVPYYMIILHGISHNRFFVFSSLPFFFIASAVLIMRNVSNFLKDRDRFLTGILHWIEMRSIFFLVLSLVIAGLTSIIVLPLLGMGISLMPEILITIPVLVGITLNLRKIYLENRGNFQDAFFLTQILLFAGNLILLLKTRLN